MRIENLNNLIDGNAQLIRIAKKKQRSLMKLKEWVAGFEDTDPPTQTQLNTKIGQLEMADLNDAFQHEKWIFLNSEVIPDVVL